MAQGFFNRFGNYLVRGVLCSPLRGLLDASTMLVLYRGRKSGKSYATPVNYVTLGEELSVISRRERTWWRNLRGAGSAGLLLRGEEIETLATVIEDAEAAAAALEEHLRRSPTQAKYLGIAFD